jgi:hypothetical protein
MSDLLAGLMSGIGHLVFAWLASMIVLSAEMQWQLLSNNPFGVNRATLNSRHYPEPECYANWTSG